MISRNLTLRLIIAAIFIPLLVYVFWIGGRIFVALVQLLIVLSIWEFLALGKVSTYWWQRFFLLVLGAIPPMLLAYLSGQYLGEWLLAVFFLTTLPYVFSHNLGDLGRSIALSFFGVVYLTASFSCLILIRLGDVVSTKAAGGWVIFLFATIWIVDTAAYYAGVQWGSAKLSPVISPNKTIAGLIGGFAGGIVSAGIFSTIFLSEVGYAKLLLPAMIIALFGQLGDLVESIYKREAGVKDSSNLIPGHGGILDRFDSLVFAAPALYLYLKYLG